MSRIYDNWERLVAAVIRRDQLWQLFHEHSRSPSICSESSSDYSSNFTFSPPRRDVFSPPGAERVEVMRHGKPVKELTALYKTQEIQAHNGSIWTIRFSLDGMYLASAGEDCVIHVRRVVEMERKGDLCSDSSEDLNFNIGILANGLPEKKRRGKSSISGKSGSIERIFVPETVFALSENPICSFEGHLADVQDLSWSKSQQLLSSSMDKTVRLWDLSTKTCLKIFLHCDYGPGNVEANNLPMLREQLSSTKLRYNGVTCIQFNPVDDRYFISGSIDAKVRIWSIPDHQVVDWIDLHEIITATCYTPDGQGAFVGSYVGSCHIYETSDNMLRKISQIILPNRKKITGLQFASGSTSEVLMTSADSKIRLIDGLDCTHRFRGFRNTNSQISASLTSNRKHIVSASEDSHVYVWRHEGKSRPNRRKGAIVTQSCEFFHCQDVSVAIPWPGLLDTSGGADHFEEVSTDNRPTSPTEETNGNDSLPLASTSTLNGTLSGATSNNHHSNRISITWPVEKLMSAIKNRNPRVSLDFSNGLDQSKSPAWGMVIVAAGLRGEIRTFQNFGLPILM
ncbi:hypothetical protein BUALT_Bualt03G0134400 [Buddleja alternifolia]|uniref:WD repeat-containing protein 44 n=1 Tax=Buddleja alternifolia TaxID=168488 RepID=A0AAV6Y1U3_9LAMI|nr:hypothetical protein BUALT_Bualt03G0134400 [Buddleja alternifolia]